MRILNLVLTTCLMSTFATAQELSWLELVRRPELWPAQCILKQAIKFEGGRGVQAGQKLNVLQVKANEIQLRTTDGRTTFAAEPDETDALAVASEAYAKLTPKQRELTYPSLVQRKDLWPYRVALTQTFDLGGGKTLRQGDPLRLMDVQPGKLFVLAEEIKTPSKSCHKPRTSWRKPGCSWRMNRQGRGCWSCRSLRRINRGFRGASSWS